MTWSTCILDESTWPLFAELVDRNNRVYGGCWCMGYHSERPSGAQGRHDAKLRRVREDGTHASLVLDGDGIAQAWAQWGGAEELDGFKHQREYDKEPPRVPDWRITCVFVDKAHRDQGLARRAVEDAMAQIEARGGGVVEAISEETDGRVAQQRFPFSLTAEVFDSLGFQRIRKVGKHAWIVQRRV